MYEMLALMGAVLIGSFLLARAVVAAKGKPSRDLRLHQGAKLKLLTPSGAYRCQVESSGPKGIVTTAPLYRDSYVPIRIGEKVVVQVPYEDRLLTFHSSVLARDGVYHRMTLAFPTAYRLSDRRSVPRTKLQERVETQLNGAPAAFVEVSSMGARIVTLEKVGPGDFVNIEITAGGEKVSGAVLGAEPAAIGNRMGREIRVRFDDPVVDFKPGRNRAMKLRYQ